MVILRVDNTLCVNRASLSYLKRAHFATLTANECWLQSYSSVTICFMPLCLVLSFAKENYFKPSQHNIMSKSNCLLVILQKSWSLGWRGEVTSLKMGRDIIKYQEKVSTSFRIRERKKILSSLVKTQIPIKHSTYVCKWNFHVQKQQKYIEIHLGFSLRPD